MTREVKLTKDGFERVQKAIEAEQTRLVEATRILQEQMESSDDYDDTGLEDAKREKLAIEQRIDELEETLARAVIVEASDKAKIVTLGSVVQLKEEKTGKEMEVMLVSGAEASIYGSSVRKVSDDSPLGKLLEGKKKGDVFVVDLDTRQLKYKVLSIAAK
jgi:transcription elongation factor GreA